MNTSLRNTLALLLLMLASLGTVSAQTPAFPAAPARAEIRAYYRQNVLPVVRQQRQQLDAQLSADDKAQLVTYRAQLRVLRQRSQALRQSMRPTSPANTTPSAVRPELIDAQRQQLQQLRTDNRAIMLSVAQLAQKYAAQITQLSQEIQPQQEQWTRDLQALAAKNATPGQQQRVGRAVGRGHRGGWGGLGKPTRFLLLDPAAPATEELTGLGSTAFPNPAAATMQLEYTVKKAGPVTVEVLDGRGTVLRTLMSAQPQEKGAQTVSADVRDLPVGTYFYKITTRAGVETKRFVKQ